MNKKQTVIKQMEKIDFVSVVNDNNIYRNYFIENDKINRHDLISYDNSAENIAITKRYNDYIDSKMTENNWIVFCHQDFEIHENVDKIFDNLDKKCIYGPVGAGTTNQFAFFLRIDGFKISKFRMGIVKKQIIKGQIIEESNGKRKIAGRKAKNLEIIETPDCCCFIVHSSLIQKMNFRFDENLDWHLYAEDLSLFAKLNHNIKTRIINIKATHYSSGDFDDSFDLALAYFKKKYYDDVFVTTCYDGYYERFLQRL